MVALMNSGPVVVEFTERSNTREWRIVDDVVMGGRSAGSFSLSEQGHGVFSGKVSLENNGGFSSVQLSLPEINLEGYSYFEIRLKGDGKSYQFRVRSDRSQQHSYAYYFQTSGEWQTIRIPMNEMFPTWRGMRLNMANYPGSELAEVAFLIGNKRNEEFRLEIDSIRLAV